MAPGEHGKITTAQLGKDWFEARTYIRDGDGERRKVRRTGRSTEDAERNLKRHLRDRSTPLPDQTIGDTTTLAGLFDAWITRKAAEGDIEPQTAAQYRQVWSTHAADQLGALRIRELPTSRADAHLKAITSIRQAQQLRVVLRGMFGMAAQFDVVAVNPIIEAKPRRAKKKMVKAATVGEYEQIRQAISAYTTATVTGPKRGRHLLAFAELAVATGARPNEVLAIRWEDVDLMSDPPTVTITGTLIDHAVIPGKPVHRKDSRKGDAPAVTVVLPKRAVEVLTEMYGQTGPAGLVFTNRDGGPMSLNNLRRSLRAALPEGLRWCTPHSFRRTAGTIVRDHLGVEAAQQQLGHAHLTTTEGHYVERRTTGPDAREALDKFLGGESSR